jgi:hypothetical protein
VDTFELWRIGANGRTSSADSDAGLGYGGMYRSPPLPGRRERVRPRAVGVRAVHTGAT